MNALKRPFLYASVWLVLAVFLSQSFAGQRTIGKEEIDALVRLRLTPNRNVDLTNRLERIPAAIDLGRRLFFDPRLSGNKERSCSTCHKPAHSFGESLRLSPGLNGQISRKTPSLVGVGRMRWFFHDGRSDTLWGQAAEVIESPHEMGGNRAAVASLLKSEASYRQLVSQLPSHGATGDGAALVTAAKSLAAYVNTLDFSPSRFDRALTKTEGRWVLVSGVLSDDEVAGARLFIGRARCVACHRGPALSDSLFHNLGLPVPSARSELDPGRYAAATGLSSREFGGVGAHSDDRSSGRRKVESVFADGSSWGAFRTPSLRNVGSASSFMHDGRFGTLEDVLAFYSKLEGQQVGHHDSGLLSPIDLSDIELSQLASFLRVFSEKQAAK